MPPKVQDGPDYRQIVLKDFTGGLWERGNARECPPNGLLECTDAYPLKAGGIRAFARFQKMTQTGLGSGANATGGSVPMGIYSLPGIFATNTIYMTELQVNAGGAGIHTLKMNVLSGEDVTALNTGSWTAVATIAGLTSISAGIKVATLRNNTNGYRAYFDLAAVPQANSGIYRFNTSTSAQQFQANAPHGLISSQTRLIYIVHESTVYGVPNQIQYTNASTDAAPSTAANFLSPEAEQSLPLQWITAFAPSDIVGQKLGRGLFSVQGDITSGPTVRELSFDHNVSVMYPTPSDLGVVFHVEGQGIYTYTQGLTVNSLSDAILGDPFGSAEMNAPAWTGISFNYRGQLAYSDSFLYAGKYVLDARTNAWFKLSAMDYASPSLGGMPAYACVDVSNHRIYLANYGRMLPAGTPQVLWWSPANEQDWTRSNTYAVTLPLLDLPTRLTQVRRIEIFGQGFGSGGTFTITLSNPDGTPATQPATEAIAGAAACARFDCAGTGDWVRIRIQAAGNLGAEAPMIDRIVLYYSPSQERR